MALRMIRTDEDPVLKKKSKEVKKFDDKLKTLVEDMIETMYHADGVGLAAVQIGILKRVLVIDVYDDTGVKVLINPTFVEEKGQQIEVEGCLSIPGRAGKVLRPAYVKVRAQDVTGEYFEIEGEELLARALCHEIDHLNGVLFTDIMIEEEFDAS